MGEGRRRAEPWRLRVERARQGRLLFWRVGCIFGIVAVVLATACFFSYRQNRKLQARADHAAGTVVELRRGGDSTYRPVVSFRTAQGRSVTFATSWATNPPAYRVGDTIYPQHCFINPSWYIKFPSTRFTEADRAESRAYVEDNPHAGQIRAVFDLAGLGYGRIDYGLVDGRVQTFEINNNPTVLARPPGWEAGVNYSRYADMHAAALRALMRPAGGVPLRLGGGSLAVDAVHASAMRAVRRRIALFRLRRSLSIKTLKKRLAARFGGA